MGAVTRGEPRRRILTRRAGLSLAIPTSRSSRDPVHRSWRPRLVEPCAIRSDSIDAVAESRRAGELVRELRRLSGLSQRELAERAGTSGPTIAAYESGTKEPRISTLDRLAGCAGHQLVAEVRPSDEGARKRDRRRRRSLALAAATADRVGDDWSAAARLALSNLDRMRHVVGENRSNRLLDEWQDILTQGPDAVRRALLDTSARGDDRRQMQPFAGLLTDDERRLVIAATNAWATAS